ncbi:MAG: sigma-70 family RNA polymerase sigma factor [Tepidisphaeraceae bacterium]|jgi:RNA polymerase sigma-70 factor (ECF subfamily)
MLTESDDILIQRSQRGDHAAFEALMRRTSRLVYSRVYLDTGDGHQAEDLTQEVFLTAWKSIRQLDRPQRFRPWLLTIARNAVVDAGRRMSRKKRAGPRTSSEDVLLRIPSATPPPDVMLENSERRDQVLAMLRTLPEEYRLAVSLRYIGGLDHEAIQQQLGISNGSLRGLLGRGLAMMRQELMCEPSFGVHASACPDSGTA